MLSGGLLIVPDGPLNLAIAASSLCIIHLHKENGKKDFAEHDWKGNNVLLFGSEGYGLKYHTLQNSDFLLKININNKVESLNISNSAAIVFHYINWLKK